MIKNKLMKKLEFTKFLVYQNESKMLYLSSKTFETENCLAKVSFFNQLGVWNRTGWIEITVYAEMTL